jgi:hypothetical protein
MGKRSMQVLSHHEQAYAVSGPATLGHHALLAYISSWFGLCNREPRGCLADRADTVSMQQRVLPQHMLCAVCPRYV